jgi:prevent-host-death family protein
MSSSPEPNHKTWTIVEAKARLSELLRLVREEGPQYIGTKKSFVVISEEEWLSMKQPKKPLGLWLIENMPPIGELELPDRNQPDREIPFQ